MYWIYEIKTTNGRWTEIYRDWADKRTALATCDALARKAEVVVRVRRFARLPWQVRQRHKKSYL